MASDTAAVGDPFAPESTSDITAAGEGHAHPPAPADQSRTRHRRGRAPVDVPAAMMAVFDAYVTDIDRPSSPLDADTIRVYISRVRQYLVWLADTLDAGGVDGDPLADPTARDWAARDYRTYLLTVARRKPSTVNAHLTAVDDFYRRRGLGPAAAKRADIPAAAPRALDDKAQTRWLRACEQASARDAALALVGFYAGLRIGEIVALNLDDIRISARKGHLIVRYGKGGRYREVPLHPTLRTALDRWLAARVNWPGVEGSALFLNHRGTRLSTRGAYTVLVALADTAGLDIGRDATFTPHVLRHTAGTTMTRKGVDIVLVAELLGHSMDTARRYALPSRRDRENAIARLTTDG